jgi:hypothetical protein
MMVNFLSKEDQELCIEENVFNSNYDLWINRDPLGKPVSIFFKLDSKKIDEMEDADFFLELEPGHIIALKDIYLEHMDIYEKNVEPKKEVGK